MFQGDEGNKKSSPRGKKYLTSSTKCGKIYMKRRRTLPKPERANAMKKVSLQSLVSFIDSIDAPQDIKDIRDEIANELAKGAEKAQANRDLYAQAHDVVIGALSATPVTIGELFTEVEPNLPEGFSKGKVQYAITRLWADEVVKHEGKVNTYTRA